MSEQLSLPKIYQPTAYEQDVYTAWEQSGFFNPDNLPNQELRTESFTIVLPPPNVTGTLHMGHAVMLAIEDAMTRFARMQGKLALWLPGTDHAAIATESKVERLLRENEGLSRHDLGREAFLKRVDAFAQESHDTIVNQMKKMGASVDWSREAFTLDEARNLAVRTTFKSMYDDGLIYRGNRLVNWSVGAQSVLSDDELEWDDRKEPFYYIRCGAFVIGTVRPETKCAHSPVVVHPEGEYVRIRFMTTAGEQDEIIVAKNLWDDQEQFAAVLNKIDTEGEYELIATMKGSELEGESFTYSTYAGERNFVVLADEVIDMNKGTGAMTISSSHSADDYDLAHRRNLDETFIEKIDLSGRMTDVAGPCAGMEIEEARKASAKLMKEMGLIVGEDVNYVHRVPLCYRSKTVVEPMISKQWFIDVNKPFALKGDGIQGFAKGDMVTLKQVMQTVVREQQIDILPDRFEKTYFNWIDNLRDWCISRQIWYGHQIPVWYRGEDIYVGVEAPEGEGWEQDSDTLDTWFSSGLWTFSTLGWPNDTADLKRFHPTSVLETGYDILFFWVARMVLMSGYVLGEIPFETVYLHGLVRDEKGRKMSKSLGNIINPLDMIEQYGADATRLSLLIGATPGNDSKLSEDKIASYRNFTNKLWNISRFVFGVVDEVQSVQSRPEPQSLADAWILGRLDEVIEKATGHYEAHELSLVGELLRDFTWNDFADWYVEIAKVEREQQAQSTDAILLYVLERILTLWHPLMPFVTEVLYRQFSDDMLMVRSWPQAGQQSDEAVAKFNRLREVVTGIRAIRAQFKIAYTQPIDVIISGGSDLEDQSSIIERFVKTGSLSFEEGASRPDGATSLVTAGMQVYVPLAGIVDLKEEATRLENELSDAQRYLASIQGKLQNDAFVQNAPEAVVAQQRELAQETQVKIDALKAEIEAISS